MSSRVLVACLALIGLGCARSFELDDTPPGFAETANTLSYGRARMRMQASDDVEISISTSGAYSGPLSSSAQRFIERRASTDAVIARGPNQGLCAHVSDALRSALEVDPSPEEVDAFIAECTARMNAEGDGNEALTRCLMKAKSMEQILYCSNDRRGRLEVRRYADTDVCGHVSDIVDQATGASSIDALLGCFDGLEAAQRAAPYMAAELAACAMAASTLEELELCIF